MGSSRQKGENKPPSSIAEPRKRIRQVWPESRKSRADNGLEVVDWPWFEPARKLPKPASGRGIRRSSARFLMESQGPLRRKIPIGLGSFQTLSENGRGPRRQELASLPGAQIKAYAFSRQIQRHLKGSDFSTPLSERS